MGNKSSTFRRVQPSLSHSSSYNRLSSSSKSDAQKPLLFNAHDENVEKLKHEIEENRKKNESLEKRNVTLEKDIRELRADLEKQVVELKSTASKLQSTSKSGPSGSTGPDTTLLFAKLDLQIIKLELDLLMTRRKQDTATGGQKNDVSDKKLLERLDILQSCQLPLFPKKSDTTLKKKVTKLDLQLMKVELDLLMTRRKQDITTVADGQKNVGSDKQLLEHSHQFV